MYYAQLGDVSKKNDYTLVVYSKDSEIGNKDIISKSKDYCQDKYINRLNYILRDDLKNKSYIPSKPASIDQILLIHPEDYLNKLTKENMSNIFAVGLLKNINKILYEYIIDEYFIKPSLSIVGSTIEAIGLAINWDWSVCVSGGMNICSGKTSGKGGLYSDISIALKIVFQKCDHIKRVLIIDLNYYQGSGYRNDRNKGRITKNKKINIIDFYYDCHQNDKNIKINDDDVVLKCTLYKNNNYLSNLKNALSGVKDTQNIELIIYIAGYKIVDNGDWSWIDSRDEIVTNFASKKLIPICFIMGDGKYYKGDHIYQYILNNKYNKNKYTIC